MEGPHSGPAVSLYPLRITAVVNSRYGIQIGGFIFYVGICQSLNRGGYIYDAEEWRWVCGGHK